MIINALWHRDEKSSFICREFISPASSGQISLVTKKSLISTGTEHTIATGNLAPSCYRHMDVPYMDGLFTMPLKYGYNCIAEDPETHQLFQVMHPHQDQLVIDRQDAHPIPSGIPANRAALFGTVETAMTGIWDALLEPEDTILVVGGGLIGMTIGLCVRHILGHQVQLVDIHTTRQDIAQQLGLFDPKHSKKNYQVAFHTSGSSAGLQSCIDQVGMEGRIIEMSLYKNPVQVMLGDSFHYQRKRIIASQVSSIPHRNPPESYDSRREKVWQWLTDPIFDQLITHEIPFWSLPQLFNQLRSNQLEGIGYLVTYE